MRLITNKSKNLLYRILPFVNCTIQFATSYAVATQISADTDTNLIYKCQYRKGATYIDAVFSSSIPKPEKIIKTFTTPENLDYDNIVFGVNGKSIDTLVSFPIKLKPSTTYTFTCNFTNITQGSISWKDMMLVEGSTAGDYEPYSYNLLDKWRFRATSTKNGVLFTNNGDGSWIVNGTATATEKAYFMINNENTLPAINGHTYCTLGCPSGGGTKTYFIESSFGYDYGNGIIYKLNRGIRYGNYYITIAAGYTATNLLFTPQTYDLTLMYGAGNEPTTVAQFYTDHPELKVSPFGFVGLKNLEINNKNIKRLKYKTWNNSLNLIDKSNFRPSDEGAGVTFTNNGDGSWTVNGTATAQLYLPILPANSIQLNTSHKYLLSGCPKEGSSNLFLYVDNGGALFGYDTGSGSIGIPTKTSAHITINVSPNTVVNNAIFKPALYDLTEIYGAGKEPTTVDQFYKDYPLAKTSPLGFSDLGIMPSNSGYILNEYNNLTEEILEENIEKDNINYHIPDKTNILLNKIEGKTNKIVQLINKAVFKTSDTKVGLTFTCNRTTGAVTVNGTATSGSYWNPSDGLPLINNHKYLICGNYAGSGIRELGLLNQQRRVKDNGNGGIGTVITSTESPLNTWGITWDSGTTFNNITIYPQLFDLTAMYGYGKEPTTVEQFKKDYPQFFDEKLDGIWNVRTSGISTTGKNLFDISKWIYSHYDVANGTLVERLSNGAICQGNNGTGDGDNRYSNGWFRPMYYQYPNSIYLQAGTYTLSADYTMIENSVVNTARVNCYLYGENGYNNANTTSVTVGNTVRIKSTYTVVDGYYYPVFTLNSGKVKVENIQIELNSTATTYEPYQENKIDLLSTQTLNGINGVNDYIEVVDKGNGLYDLKKTQNIDSVDLGTLDWKLGDASLVRFYSTTGFDKVKPTSETICKEYSYSQTWGNDKTAFSGIGGFGITDSSFAHKSQEEVKTALSGVYLYYQLKTPVVTTIATNLTYSQVSALRTNGGLLLVNDNNNQKYAQPNVTIKENYQYKN